MRHVMYLRHVDLVELEKIVNIWVDGDGTWVLQGAPVFGMGEHTNVWVQAIVSKKAKA